MKYGSMIRVPSLSATRVIAFAAVKPSLQVHQREERGWLALSCAVHVDAHLLPVLCVLTAGLNYCTALFHTIVTIWYLEKRNRFREAFLEFKQCFLLTQVRHSPQPPIYFSECVVSI